MSMEGLKPYLPTNRFQLFAFLFLSGVLFLYFANYFISEQLKTIVAVGPFLFLVILTAGIVLIYWLLSHIAKEDAKLGTEKWIIVIIVILSIIGLLYAFPGIVPDSFKGSMMSMRPFIGSIVGGGNP